MIWLAIVILGVVEGLTEFLPVSSTGHLVIGSTLLGFKPTWREPFLVVIQLGAILAVVVDRGPEILHMLRSGKQVVIDLAVKLALGFFPSAVLGLLVHKAISQLLKSPAGVSAAWILGGVAILLLDRRVEANASPGDLSKVTPKQALLVGLAQCLSLWPGMSRSASTILGGLAVGLDRPTATIFSFYLAIPTMFAASAYELLKFRHGLEGSALAFLLGMVVAFFVAWATVRWLLKFVQTHTFRAFAIYRIAAGALILLLPSSLWTD
jgi:undecaprenyl-diphosphatase